MTYATIASKLLVPLTNLLMKHLWCCKFITQFSTGLIYNVAILFRNFRLVSCSPIPIALIPDDLELTWHHAPSHSENCCSKKMAVKRGRSKVQWKSWWVVCIMSVASTLTQLNLSCNFHIYVLSRLLSAFNTDSHFQNELNTAVFGYWDRKRNYNTRCNKRMLAAVPRLE